MVMLYTRCSYSDFNAIRQEHTLLQITPTYAVCQWAASTAALHSIRQHPITYLHSLNANKYCCANRFNCIRSVCGEYSPKGVLSDQRKNTPTKTQISICQGACIHLHQSLYYNSCILYRPSANEKGMCNFDHVIYAEHEPYAFECISNNLRCKAMSELCTSIAKRQFCSLAVGCQKYCFCFIGVIFGLTTVYKL